LWVAASAATIKLEENRGFSPWRTVNSAPLSIHEKVSTLIGEGLRGAGTLGRIAGNFNVAHQAG
jgi:hypothetical protein